MIKKSYLVGLTLLGSLGAMATIPVADVSAHVSPQMVPRLSNKAPVPIYWR
jgi:hypothetical protein